MLPGLGMRLGCEDALGTLGCGAFPMQGEEERACGVLGLQGSQTAPKLMRKSAVGFLTVDVSPIQNFRRGSCR